MSFQIKSILWIIRIIISALFLLSAIAKMDSLWQFEKQIVDLGLSGWCGAHYLARLICGLEIAVAIGILQSHFLKKFVIPGTILLLIIFNIHLAYQMYLFGPNDSNCGCFGQLIPMTPLEAFIKNLLTIGLLIILYIKSNDLPRGHNKWSHILIIFLMPVLFLFMAYPFCPCKKTNPNIVSPLIPYDSINNTIISVPDDTIPAKPTQKDTVKTTAEKIEIKQPKVVKSRFSNYPTFSNKLVKIDEGKKIVCLFAPGCDHCQATAKTLGVLSKSKNFPPVHIIFMDEESEKIPDFFKIAQVQFPYQILNIPDFWDLMVSGSTPAVYYLWNGNIMKSFEGTKENEFKADVLQKAIDTPFK